MVSSEVRRLERISEIKKLVDKNVDNDKIIAHFGLKWGTTRRTILEYIKASKY